MRILALLLLSFSVWAEPKICQQEPLACNIYFEARGEPLDGQYAVAFVTLNRFKAGFGSTVREVVYQKGQFSWVGTPVKINDKISWDRSLRIAEELQGLTNEEYYRRDFTFGALYFHSIRVKPRAFRNSQRVATIGGHHFYL